MSLTLLYFGLYTLFLVIIWGFFIIIRIHAIKFKNFQTRIITSLKTLCFLLIFFSIAGYIALYFVINSGNTYNIKKIDNIDSKIDINETIDDLQEEVY